LNTDTPASRYDQDSERNCGVDGTWQILVARELAQGRRAGWGRGRYWLRDTQITHLPNWRPLAALLCDAAFSGEG
jgi:hypothetical protein